MPDTTLLIPTLKTQEGADAVMFELQDLPCVSLYELLTVAASSAGLALGAGTHLECAGEASAAAWPTPSASSSACW